jgi:hypothetical protein
MQPKIYILLTVTLCVEIHAFFSPNNNSFDFIPNQACNFFLSSVRTHSFYFSEEEEEKRSVCDGVLN